MNTSASEAQSQPDNVTKTGTSAHTHTPLPPPPAGRTSRQTHINAAKRNDSKILFSARVVLVCYFLLPSMAQAGRLFGGSFGRKVAAHMRPSAEQKCKAWLDKRVKTGSEPPAALMTSGRRG